MRVNKVEMAHLLGCSLPTLSAYMTRYGDAFPVLTQGGIGRGWSFDPEAVIAFLDNQREAAAQADIERQEALLQFALPLGHNGGPPIEAAPYVRPADQLALMKVRRLQREEAYACGRLVEVSKVSSALENLLNTWNRQLHQSLRQFGRDRELAPDLIADLETTLSQCQRNFVAYMRTVSVADDAQPSLFMKAAE